MYGILSIAGCPGGILEWTLGALVVGFVIALFRIAGHLLFHKRSASTPPPEVPGPTASAPDRAGSHEARP
jgi:hypothetical protein